MTSLKETDLYLPIKALLEAQGYEVKAEVGHADIVAKREDEPLVIIELKLKFSMTLFHQAIERAKLSDSVYIAVQHQAGKVFAAALKKNIALAKRAGFGVMTVRFDEGRAQPPHVMIHADPGPYHIRINPNKHKKLLRAFERLKGDPNLAGAPKSAHLITGYRQDAMRCAVYLHAHGPSRGADIKAATGIKDATRILRDNHYGWFERVKIGTYKLSDTAPALSDLHPIHNFIE